MHECDIGVTRNYTLSPLKSVFGVIHALGSQRSAAVDDYMKSIVVWRSTIPFAI